MSSPTIITCLIDQKEKKIYHRLTLIFLSLSSKNNREKNPVPVFLQNLTGFNSGKTSFSK